MTAGTAAGRKAAGWLLTPVAALAPLDRGQAAGELKDVAAAAGEAELPRLASFLSQRGAAQDFLAAVFDLSPFLRDVARRRPQILDGLFEQDVDGRLAAIAKEIEASPRAEGVTEAGLMMRLRLLKTEAHFLIALAELAGVAEVALTVRRLSDLADACVRAPSRAIVAVTRPPWSATVRTPGGAPEVPGRS